MFRVNINRSKITWIIDHKYVEMDLLNEIRRQFLDTRLQYVCIASEKNAMGTKSHLHVQIITKQTIDKRSWFLDDITGKNSHVSMNNIEFFFSLKGTHCNYQITNNDKAWNEYIKKSRF